MSEKREGPECSSLSSSFSSFQICAVFLFHLFHSESSINRIFLH